MHTPLYSTITLFAELIVSAVIYYALYSGYRRNRFPAKSVAVALAYEILFNITYMASQFGAHVEAKLDAPFDIGLAIVHGSLSLVMFIALLVFFFFAWKAYGRGTNFFAGHKKLTITFTVFWTFSILSGILFYIVEYIRF